MVLTYYAPYVSGLTESARRLAEELVRRGRRVTVVTTRHRRSLPAFERINGVDVRRCAILARVSKGTVSPGFPVAATVLARRAQLVHLHVPMVEAGVIARLARAVPLITTYYCDVTLPPTGLNRLIVGAIDGSSRWAIARSAAVAVLSDDYARSSRLAAPLESAASVPIPPPCEDRRGGHPLFRESGGLHVGFVGRMVEEKGIEHLVAGFRRLADPNARLLLAGEHAGVAGGSVISRVRAAAAGDSRIRLLGFVPESRLPDYYASIDVLALPSVNSLEAFGIVQAEAIMCGIPVIASDLPGVRVPVLTSGYGWLVRPGDDAAITAALQRIQDQGLPRDGPVSARAAFGLKGTVDAYEGLYARVSRGAGVASRATR